MQYFSDNLTLAIGLAVLLGFVGLYAAQHALLSKRDPRSALAWVVVCIALPLVGSVTYLIFGINRIHARARSDYGGERTKVRATADFIFRVNRPRHDEQNERTQERAEYLCEPPGTSLRPLSQVGEALTGRGLVSADGIDILYNGEDFYPALLADIGEARESVYCSTYIFRRDDTGKSLVAALVAARERGVDVRIIVDGLGELVYGPRIGGLLERRGLNFRRYNPINFSPLSLRLNMRNHRKLLVIDNETAYTGGQNLSDNHLAGRLDNSARTLDLHFRFTGKIVDDMQRAFLNDWDHCGGEMGGEPESQVALNESAANWTRLILDGPSENMDKLNDLLLGVFSSARRRIWLMTPYFLPAPELMGALIGAHLRGVDVKIILPARTNIHLAHYAAQHDLQYVLARKLAVYLQPAPFVHTKATLIDEQYALIGSANMDPRSLRLNFELGVEVFSAAFNASLSRHFEERLALGTRLDTSHLTARPYWIRIRDAVAWLFSPYL
ncbi:MAG: phospholipase D-like domain-containing protein [Pseudohongiellaceae bacterium]